MSKVKIYCTSTGALEFGPDRYKDLGIGIIRVHMTFKGKEYLEGPELDPVKFYDDLENLENPRNNLPKTSVPSPGEVMEHFDKAIEDGYEELIVFSISTGLGGTHAIISQVAKEYEGRLKIHVIDTKTAGFLEGIHAVRAKEMLDNGASVEEILKESEWAIAHQRFFGVVGNLDFLIYNGRLKGAKAFMGQLFKICPVLRMDEEGHIVPLESVRTQKKSLNRLCEYLKEAIGDRSPEDYVLFHIHTGPNLLKMLCDIEVAHDIKVNHEDMIMTPVSGCHNGPWLAGYSLYLKRRPDEEL